MRELNEIFRFLDRSGDGQISLEELKIGLSDRVDDP